jgi:hypothetical protein
MRAPASRARIRRCDQPSPRSSLHVAPAVKVGSNSPIISFWQCAVIRRMLSDSANIPQAECKKAQTRAYGLSHVLPECSDVCRAMSFGAAMGSLDVDALLRMVGDMDVELDRYLAGSSNPSEAFPRLLQTCRNMRAMELDSATQHWLGSIEHHVREIRDGRTCCDDNAGLFSSSDMASSKLLQDIYRLRLRLLNVRSSLH